MSRSCSRDHAIVIGASMGGLLAARALAGHFTRVTIVERDALPPEAANRKGVPQGEHAHGLLARGREIIEDFFPGITDELVARGAMRGEVAGDVLWHSAGGFLADAPEGLVGVLLSRPLLESQVRARVAALPNVTIVSRCEVVGLLTSADCAGIGGIRRQSAPDMVENLAADLVVDASGAGTKSRAWIAAFGFAAPEEETVHVGLGYTTRLYRRRAGDADGRLGVVVLTEPPNPRGGVALALEGDRWIVSAVGYFGLHPAAADAGFLDFLARLPNPALHDLVRAAEPISDYRSFKFGGSVRRRYEKLKRFPEGYLVFGDAISRFNPVFGQGMTSAALQAAALDASLASGAEPLWRHFFRAAGRIIDVPWSIAAGADLAFPQAQGSRGPMVKFLNWYIAKLHRAAHGDADLALAFHKVTNLVAPPATLLSPRIGWRVLRGNLAFRRPERRSSRLPRVQGAG